MRSGPTRFFSGRSSMNPAFASFWSSIPELKIFHYILDETGQVADPFSALKAGEPILIGKRTGFAFYQFDGRKILIGVDARQSGLTTISTARSISCRRTSSRGRRCARRSSRPTRRQRQDRPARHLFRRLALPIHPYLLYGRSAILWYFTLRASKAVAAVDRAACFVIGNEEAQRKNPQPLALKRR